ncbi:type II toxin-antitoxin system RelE/ParE family toxin [Bacteroides sp. OttesenSCG-928-F21]|nr:type II toxin-antitoxin system RelE/ParE family toxin [Bacteroides sp. OttesenSCG-928-F21]
MALKIEWSDNASKQIKGIFEYHKEVANLRVARKIVKLIYTRVTILINNPRAGQREGLLNDRPQEFRYLVEGNYKIIYWLEADRIMISTVFDCRQNPVKMIEEVTEPPYPTMVQEELVTPR